MWKLIDLLKNVVRDVIDTARYFYSECITSLGPLGRFLVNVLVGATIVLLVGIDFVFIDFWEELSGSRYFVWMISSVLVVHVLFIVKVIAMLQALQSTSENRIKG
jgi:hypothetical protein